MVINYKPIFICLLLCSHLFVQVQANESDLAAILKDEMAFMNIVNETGGYITQRLHDDFWEMMKKKYSQEQQEKLVNDIQDTLEVIKDFQIQTWKNAKTSYFAKNISQDDIYLRLKDKLAKHQTQFFYPKAIIENAEKIVAAAASRCSLDLGAGKFYITPELIEENMVGIKGSYERLKLLLKPFWQEEYKEFFLPNINISLLSLYSPDEYHELIQQGDEQININIAQLSVDKNATYEIGAIDYQKGDKKFADFVPQEKQIYIQEFVKEQFAGYNISNPLLSKGMWRGNEFLKGVASLGSHNIVIMSLFVDAKAFYIKYITTSNLALAGSEFNEFTKRIQLKT